MLQPFDTKWCETCGNSWLGCDHELTTVTVFPQPEDGQALVRFASPAEQDQTLWQDYEQLMQTPLPFPDLATTVRQISLFASPVLVRRLLHFHHLTSLVRDVAGSWLEFGVGYGRDLAWWHCLKTLEPARHPYTRIAGFDTWEGHKGTTDRDGGNKFVQEGAYATPQGYEQFLKAVLVSLEESFQIGTPIALVKGDVRDTLPGWLKENSDLPVAFAYLDLDLYEPTKFVLEQIKDRMAAGGVIGFDEFGSTLYPGEGKAILETFGFNQPFRRSPYGDWTYLIV